MACLFINRQKIPFSWENPHLGHRISPALRFLVTFYLILQITMLHKIILPWMNTKINIDHNTEGFLHTYL